MQHPNAAVDFIALEVIAAEVPFPRCRIERGATVQHASVVENHHLAGCKACRTEYRGSRIRFIRPWYAR